MKKISKLPLKDPPKSSFSKVIMKIFGAQSEHQNKNAKL